MHIQFGDSVSASISIRARNHYLGSLPRVVSHKFMCSIFMVMGTIVVYGFDDSSLLSS
jgi:hypothetical protein